MCYGRQVSIQIMGDLSVGDRIAVPSVGIYSDILVRTVRKRGVGPSVLVIGGKLIVEILS